MPILPFIPIIGSRRRKPNPREGKTPSPREVGKILARGLHPDQLEGKPNQERRWPWRRRQER